MRWPGGGRRPLGSTLCFCPGGSNDTLGTRVFPLNRALGFRPRFQRDGLRMRPDSCFLLFLMIGLLVAVRPAGLQAEEAEREVISFTRGPSGSNFVALTFDDGPHPKLTPRLLEILEAEDVPATFFMLGTMIEKYPETARAVAMKGHEIANHAFTHDRLTRLDTATVRDEVVRTQTLLEKVTGTEPRLFRAPYGAVDSRVRKELLDQDLELVGWAVDPRDWERGKTSETITSFILEHADGGDIILLHDIHTRSVNAVVDVIRGLKARGLEFTTAGDLIARKRDEMRRDAELAAKQAVPLDSSFPASALPPAEPPVVPLGRSSMKRYKPSTKQTVNP